MENRALAVYNFDLRWLDTLKIIAIYTVHTGGHWTVGCISGAELCSLILSVVFLELSRCVGVLWSTWVLVMQPCSVGSTDSLWLVPGEVTMN